MMTGLVTTHESDVSSTKEVTGRNFYVLFIGLRGKPDSSLLRVLEERMRVDVVDGDAVSQAVAFDGLFDAIILDGPLDGADGSVALSRELRHHEVKTPILCVTDGAPVDRLVEAFGAGADDVIIKPLDPTLLVARLDALGRRTVFSPVPAKLRVADLVLDLQRQVVRRGSREIGLSISEFVLLEYLMRHPGEVLSGERIASDLRRRVDELVRDTAQIIVDLERKLDRGARRPLIRAINGSQYVLDG